MAKQNFISRVKGAFSVLKGRSIVFADNNWKQLFSFIGGDKEEDSEQVVNSTTGTGIGTIFNCLNLLGQDIATLPKQIRQDTKDGKTVIKNNLHKVLNLSPNKYDNAWQFWFSTVFLGEAWGNAYAYISERDQQGYATELIRLKPWMVTAEIVDQELYYVVNGKVSIHSSDIFHYRSLITDNVIGENKIIYNAKTVGLKLKQQKYASKSVGNKPPGILFQNGTDEQRKANKEIWNSQVSGDNLAGTPVLSGEIDYKPLMMDPKATEIVLQNNLSDQYLMGIWRIQPAKLSIHQESNYNVVEQQNIIHVRDALMPIVVNLEQEINRKLFPQSNAKKENPEYVKFNLKSLLRADTATQTAYYQFLRTGGITSADEIREWEDMPPQKDEKGNVGIGQKYFIQGAMVEVGKQPTDTQTQTAKMLDDFARKHKMNGYAKEL